MATIIGNHTYRLIRRAGSNGHHFYRRDDDALIIADHSGDDMFDAPPENPEICDDGACVVVRIEDESRRVLMVRDGYGSIGHVHCSEPTFDYARRQLGSPITDTEANKLERDIRQGVNTIRKALERYIRAFPATSTERGEGNCFYNLFDAEDAMEHLNKLIEKTEEMGVEF